MYSKPYVLFFSHEKESNFEGGEATDEKEEADI